MDADYLQVCERLKASKERFWDILIDTSLKPIESSPREQAEVAAGLASLRNNIAFAIILLNGLLVLAIFLIQRNKEILSFNWTLTGGMHQVKMNPMTGKYEETDDPLEVDPLGMGIIVFLSGILIVQKIGMIIHRPNTLLGAFQEPQAMQEAAATPPERGPILPSRHSRGDSKGWIESSTNSRRRGTPLSKMPSRPVDIRRHWSNGGKHRGGTKEDERQLPID